MFSVRKMMFSLIIVALLALLFTIIVPMVVEASHASWHGQWFEQKNGHNYVAFTHVYYSAANGWGCSGPMPCSVWNPPDRYGYVEAGFKWFDWLNPYLFFSPSDFRIYPLH